MSAVLAGAVLLTGCAATDPASSQAAAPAAANLPVPEPIYGNTGQYFSPFTEDGTVTPWVEKALTASAGAGIGNAAGAYLGQKALENVPFVGGFLGGMAGKAAGREIALNVVGGWEYVKETSDLSFNSLEDMARYMAAKNSAHPQYADVLKATNGIYPDLMQAMASAYR
jgi:hypothetical protein